MQIRQGMESYDTKIDDCIDIVLNLDKYYDSKNTEVKQKIIGSVFPEKLNFKDKQYRTTKLNQAVEILCKTDKGLGQKKGGKKTELSVSSLRVESEGFEPPFFPITFIFLLFLNVNLRYTEVYSKNKTVICGVSCLPASWPLH